MTPTPRPSVLHALPAGAAPLLLAAALAGCTASPVRDAPAAATTAAVAAAAPAQAQPSGLERFATPAQDILSGGRISAGDLPALRAAGIGHVIDLTPDAETPAFDEAAEVRAAGLRYDNLPIAGPADLTRDAVVAFDALLDGVDGPALVHCASGNRVGALVALRAAWLDGADDEAAVAEGRRWGLTGLEGAVRERLARDRCVAAAGDDDAVARCAAGG